MLGENGTISGYADCYDLINYNFKLIEEQQDIDIQAIEELKPNTVFDTKETIRNHYNKINELVQAVKQLDRREER